MLNISLFLNTIGHACSKLSMFVYTPKVSQLSLSGNRTNENGKFLPIDTKYQEMYFPYIDRAFNA